MWARGGNLEENVTEWPTNTVAEPVPHAVFSLNAVEDRERFDLWRDSISCIFEVEADRETRAAGFDAVIDANMFGPVMLARTTTKTQHWARTPSIMARDGMDHYMVQLFERGQMRWDTSKGTFESPVDGLVIFDLAQEVRSYTDNFTNISLIIPRDMMDRALKSPDDQHLRVLTNDEPMVKLLRDHMLSLKSLAGRMTARQAIEIAPATVGLTAACLNAAVEWDAPDQRNGLATAQLTVIRRFIEENLSEPELSVDWLAGRVGVSRSKLYQMFEPFGGVGSYIRDRRLRRALIALTDERAKHRPIYDIALASGYTSDAAFSRVFRARYGMSPREVRNQGGVGPAQRPGGIDLDRRYENWLHHLSV